jgi:uncharacterized protein with von Willebrand factor type A (vWA) domain
MRQYSINHKEELFEAIKKHYKDTDINIFYNMFYNNDFEVLQINSCQAWILKDKFGNKYLQSYNTIVSVKFADETNVLRLGKWSVTTSKQQTLFERIV